MKAEAEYAIPAARPQTNAAKGVFGGNWLRKVAKRILKTVVAHFAWNRLRLVLLRGCGFEIGSDVYIGEGLIIVENLLDRDHVFIGDRVSLAPRVMIVTDSHPNNSRIRPFVTTARARVVIEHDAWIGAGAIIFPGVTIGAGAVVGAGAIVTKDVASHSIVAGIPAKEVGQVSFGH